MKRLIVCCDGTWQKLTSDYPTNVVKITQAIKSVGDDGATQIVYYSEGVGTGDLIDKLGGGAFGYRTVHLEDGCLAQNDVLTVSDS